ncbi:MAG: amidohydrolase family protein [Xanthomonadales bacterium]|nr:amidohydrolase family protein [Xanthomonadales bacterium]
MFRWKQSALFLLLVAASAVAGKEGHRAFVGVNLVPMDRPQVIADQTVLVRDGRIVVVGDREDTALPPGTSVIDGSGRWLMPGLVDVHVHVDDPSDLLLYLANGVTTVVNLKGRPEHLRLREELARGERLGPRLLSCGPFIRGHEVDTGAEVRDRVRAIVDDGYDCVKMYDRDWSAEEYDAIVDATRKARVPLIGHAPRDLGLEPVFEHGAQRIAHLEELVYATPKLDAWVEAAEALEPGTAPVLDETIRAELEELADRVAAAGLWVSATEIVIDTYALRSTEAGLAELAARDYTRYLDPLNRRWWATRGAGPAVRFTHQVALQYFLLEELRRRDVPMALGTDADSTSNLLVMPGWSVHLELEILAKAGFSAHDALRQATVNSAGFLDRPGEVGVAEGARADLLLLATNPLEDVSHVQDIEGVMVSGRWYPRSTLEERLAERLDRWAPIEARVDEAEAMAAREGPVAGADRYLAIAADHPEFAKDVESLVNRIGYDLLAAKKTGKAIKVFTRNRDTFPESPNTWDSLAEAHLEAGHREQAIELYRRALALDPNFGNAARMLEELNAGN